MQRRFDGSLIEQSDGCFDGYGGRYVPETLVEALDELESGFFAAVRDERFLDAYASTLATFVGRPTPLTKAERLSEYLGGVTIYLKREDLCHTGAHKINNAVGQALLAKRLRKTRIVADTGAGQHGTAVAAVCAALGLECTIYMGEVDMKRQQPNVDRMRLFGAQVRGVSTGQATLKEAVTETIRDWLRNVDSTHCLLGSALGPHPYPVMVREFQRIIGIETKEQILAREGRLPDMMIACVGGGSNSIGFFSPFLRHGDVQMIGVEAGGEGIDSGRHAARFADAQLGRIGVLHGCRSYVLQDLDGQILPTHSVSAGLDYPMVGPEHALLRDMERVQYTDVTDEEALQAFRLLTQLEGILPALESSHAIAELIRRGRSMSNEKLIAVNISGRGDKDLATVMSRMQR